MKKSLLFKGSVLFFLFFLSFESGLGDIVRGIIYSTKNKLNSLKSSILKNPKKFMINTSLLAGLIFFIDYLKSNYGSKVPHFGLKNTHFIPGMKSIYGMRKKFLKKLNYYFFKINSIPKEFQSLYYEYIYSLNELELIKIKIFLKENNSKQEILTEKQKNEEKELIKLRELKELRELKTKEALALLMNSIIIKKIS